MRTWLAGMGGSGAWALRIPGAASNKKERRTERAETMEEARRCMIHTPELVKLFSPADFNEAKNQWAWSNNPVSTRLALRMIAPSQCDVQPKGQGYRRADDGVEC